MRGIDRCDEIVRLIDETLGEALSNGPAAAVGTTPAPPPATPAPATPAPATRAPATRAAGGHVPVPVVHSCFHRPAADGADRQRLLAAVGDFLAGSLGETAPSAA